MSEEIIITPATAYEVGVDEYNLWDVQRDQKVEVDYIRGRTIEFVKVDEDHQIILVLKEIN